MSSKTSKNETLNLTSAPTNTEEKEVTMSMDLDSATVEQLRAALAKKEEKGKRDQLTKELEGVAFSVIVDFLAVLDGDKVITSPGAKKGSSTSKKPTNTPKEWEIANGKPYFGGEEIKNTKKDNAGRLRIVKNGKGLPPEVEKVANEAVKALLMALPVIKK